MPRWPDVEKLAVAYLSAATGHRVATRVPPDLIGNVPFIRVARGPGSDDEISDSPLLDVETFTARDGSTGPSRWDLAEEVRGHMHALVGAAVNGVLVDTVSTATGPVYLDYGNEDVDRMIASYRLQLRKKF